MCGSKRDIFNMLSSSSVSVSTTICKPRSVMLIIRNKSDLDSYYYRIDHGELLSETLHSCLLPL